MISPPLPAPQAIPVIVKRHAEEVATRWWRRGAAYCGRRRTRFDDLADFDQSIDAHLDGLLESGSLALTVLERGLSTDAPDLAADLFALFAYALLLEDENLVRRLLLQTDALPGKAWALEGVLGWHDSPLATRILMAHLHAPDIRLRAAALAQCHSHGFDGGDALTGLLNQADPALLARVIQTAGACGRRDLLPRLDAWCQAATPIDPQVRYWAAWACILLGHASASALETLRQMVLQRNEQGRDALRLLCVTLPEEELGGYLQYLSQIKLDSLLVLEAIGWSGNVLYVPWLIGQMRIPARSRMAGEALRLITGFDCDEADAALEEPHQEGDEAGQEDATLGPEDIMAAAFAVPPVDLVYPQPDADKVALWWQHNQGAFEGQPRLLLGRPLQLEWLDHILDDGEQAHRELAALWRMRMLPGSMLIPTGAHAMVQWRRLQAAQSDNPSGEIAATNSGNNN